MDSWGVLRGKNGVVCEKNFGKKKSVTDGPFDAFDDFFHRKSHVLAVPMFFFGKGLFLQKFDFFFFLRRGVPKTSLSRPGHLLVHGRCGRISLDPKCH